VEVLALLFFECVILLNSLSLIQAVLVKHLCLVFQPILSGTVMFFFRNKVRWWVISAIIFTRLERIKHFLHQDPFTQYLTYIFYAMFSEFFFRAKNARRRFLFSPLIPLPTARKAGRRALFLHPLFQHMMIDLGTGNNNKINWPMHNKQEMVGVVHFRVASASCLVSPFRLR